MQIFEKYEYKLIALINPENLTFALLINPNRIANIKL